MTNFVVLTLGGSIDQTSANSFKLINLPQLVKLDLNKGVPLYSTNFDPHIVFRNLPSLRSCYMNSARIDTLDFSQCAKLDSLTLESFDDKRDIKFLNLKNGRELKYFRNTFSSKINNICVDNAIEESFIKSKILKPNNTTYIDDCESSNDYASFSGNVDVVNIFSGQNVLSSFYIPINITDDNKNVKIFTEQNGKYSYKTKSLNKKITISPVIDLSQFEFQDTTKSYDPNEHLDYLNQNFTLYSNQLDVDLKAYIYINATIRPGREITCFIEIKNFSPFEANAGFTFEFDAKFMKFINNQNLTLLSPSLIEGKASKIAAYSNFILPLTFLLNKPTDVSPLIGGELLKFEFKVIPSQQDMNLTNNTFVFNQRVTNSMDPNNILCAQGDIVKSNEEIKTLTYTINFENLGTATAQDISIENLIDTNKLNINSFELINFSHYAKVSIIGDKAFFEFNNIELPFSGKNKGYVSYSISPKKNLEIGDSITNQANIYFDFNLPISTNQHILKLDVTNKTNEGPLEELIIYPNPNSGNFYLKGNIKNISSLCIYNLLGIELGCYNDIENEIKTQLTEGHYLVELQFSSGLKEVKKVIISK